VGAAATAGAGVPGAIRSREDASRALDAVAEYFRTTEPSSPLPLLLERARRLIACDFLQVLAELVPDAVSDAKRVGGIRDES
jgi:type VI secretion system protein ImpA